MIYFLLYILNGQLVKLSIYIYIYIYRRFRCLSQGKEIGSGLCNQTRKRYSYIYYLVYHIYLEIYVCRVQYRKEAEYL